jgi:hypothetical protein
VVLSNVARIIPESVKKTYHEWRISMRKAEQEMTGDDKINDRVDMAGWGVEEAEAANKKDASMFTLLCYPFPLCLLNYSHIET